MTPTPFVPDYCDFFQQERHSNVSLLIVEEAGAPGDASVARKLPGHSMVLAAFSHYCKAKLETWSHTGSFQSSRVQDASLAWPLGPLVALFNCCKAKLAPWSYAGAYNSSSTECKLEVLLPVPAGQQELAELLVKGMYQAQPTITDGLSQLQLLQLMLLADRFGVPKGQPMRIKVEIKAVDTDDKAADTDRAPVLHIGAFLGLRDLPAGSMRLVAATISVLPLKAAAPPSKTTGELTERLMSPERIWGFPQLVPLGTQRSWQAVKAELYRMELVHGGTSAAAVPDQEHSSHLHIKVEVKQLL
ncbi:hypothetical protein OEZ85_005288 [Tetradesmus obliquus]|uniref:Uncharacterized protein n=1 Tax=Tetradesmus obliquus TaxID=3088 RepID=A0ABY8UHE5_TETOB|nr:hypothetical protein OEZ85_005288 [Tetradesmus obliquus]